MDTLNNQRDHSAANEDPAEQGRGEDYGEGQKQEDFANNTAREGQNQGSFDEEEFQTIKKAVWRIDPNCSFAVALEAARLLKDYGERGERFFGQWLSMAHESLNDPAEIWALAQDYKETIEGEEARKWGDPDPIDDGELEPADNYPLGVLPNVILAAAEEAARFAKMPVVMPSMVGLSVAALAIGKKARVEERQGLYHHPALFLCCIAASGERKSPAFKHMTGPIESWMESQEESYQKELTLAKIENTVIDGLISKLKTKAASPETLEAERSALINRMTKEDAARPPIPPSPRLFTTDTTEERLFQKLHDHGGSYAVLSGEGRQVIDSILGKYSGKDRTGDGIYLAGISGDTITRDRVGNESGPEDLAVINPCLNVGIMVQPDKYLEAARHPALRASGALARIWAVRPPSLVGTRFEQPGALGLQEWCMTPYNNVIKQILATQPPKDPATGKPIPHLVTLSPEAAEARRLFHNHIESLMAEGGEYEDVRDLACKAVSSTVKAAMVLHLVANPHMLQANRSELPLDTWFRAQRLGEYHLREAIKIQRGAMVDAIASGAAKLIKWLVKTEREVFAASEIQQHGPKPRPTKNDLDYLLKEMTEKNWIRPLPVGSGERVPRFEVNPALFSLFSLFSPGSRAKAKFHSEPDTGAKQAKQAKQDNSHSNEAPEPPSNIHAEQVPQWTEESPPLACYAEYHANDSYSGGDPWGGWAQ